MDIVMKRIISLLLVSLICSACFSYRLAFATDSNSCLEENNTEFAVKSAEIIKNDNNEAEMLRIIGRLRSNVAKFDFPYISNCIVSENGRFVLQFTSEQELVYCLNELNNDPNILYAERDCTVYTCAVEETYEYLSWGVRAIEADIYSQAITPSSSDCVTIAIIDSGCEDIDFIKDKLIDGYDFFDNDSDATNDTSVDSHGTFLASIVADCVDNLPIKIMPVRVLDSKEASLINVVNGIIYAVDNGADVINISLGAVLSNCSSLEDAVNYAEENNVSVVACAGNLKKDIKDFCPAHIENVITVSSVNHEFKFSEGFSGFGDKIDFAAPGENIIGYNNLGEKTTLSGTSMSTAFVSASVAMFRLDNPTCNNNQVRDALISCTEDYGDEGWDKYYGHGILKLGNLINNDIIHVESIKFPQNSYELFVGDTLEIAPVFSPADATDKSFSLTASESNISVNGSIITAVSPGTLTITVTSNDGSYSDTAQITVTEKVPEIISTLKIKNNNGAKTINFGETLRLTAETTNQPENTLVWWYVNGIKSGKGNTFEVAPKNGSVLVTAKLVNADETVVKDIDGNEISDSQIVTSKSGFFQKLISFFKNLFGLNRTVIQSLMR